MGKCPFCGAALPQVHQVSRRGGLYADDLHLAVAIGYGCGAAEETTPLEEHPALAALSITEGDLLAMQASLQERIEPLIEVSIF